MQAHIVVTGTVIGVFFRAYTKQAADHEGVTGWVRNVDDTVELIVQGDKQKIKHLITWLHKGSPSSTVSDVQVTWEEQTDTYADFSIR